MLSFLFIYIAKPKSVISAIRLLPRQLKGINRATNIVPHIKICSICSEKVVARGLCAKHYNLDKKANPDSRYTGHLPLPERLDVLSTPIPESGCRIWLSNINTGGYGRIGIANKVYLAQRVAYEHAYGKIPDGLHVCHKCDTPSCVNPAHLFLGTDADNMRDKVNKKRHCYGEKHSVAVLTERQVAAIRKDTRIQRVIAEEYGVSQSQISLIHRGDEWSHLGKTDLPRTEDNRVNNGNGIRGTQCPAAKLDDDKVRDILTGEMSNTEYALKYSISLTTIQKIQKRTAWKHVI